MIECAGGRVENRRRRTVEMIKEANPPGRDPSYIIVTCEDDLHLVEDVLKARIGIYNVGFVMAAILSGEMDFDISKCITTA